MRILIINPNSDERTCEIMARKAKNMNLPDVEVDVTRCMKAPKLVCSYEEQASSGEEMVEIIRTTKDRYDAYIIACHSDPNLDLIREMAGSKPVVGIARLSMKRLPLWETAMRSFLPASIPSPRRSPWLHKYRCDDLLHTMKATKSDSNEDLLEASKEAVKEFGVDCIVMGCANFANADGYIERELGIPVIDGVAAALFMAFGLVYYNRCKERF